VPFNATVAPADAQATPANAEIIRVTARSGDTFSTIVRTQESSSTRSIVVGDRIWCGLTVKTMQDLEDRAGRTTSTAADPGSSLTTNATPSTSETVYAANAARLAVAVYNVDSDPAKVAWVAEGPSATVGAGTPIYPGGPPYASTTYLGQITVISSSASVVLSRSQT
jgi:hypothetical protein